MHPNQRLLISFFRLGDWPTFSSILPQYSFYHSLHMGGGVLWVVTHMMFHIDVGGGLQLFLDNKA